MSRPASPRGCAPRSSSRGRSPRFRLGRTGRTPSRPRPRRGLQPTRRSRSGVRRIRVRSPLERVGASAATESWSQSGTCAPATSGRRARGQRSLDAQVRAHFFMRLRSAPSKTRAAVSARPATPKGAVPNVRDANRPSSERHGREQVHQPLGLHFRGGEGARSSPRRWRRAARGQAKRARAALFPDTVNRVTEKRQQVDVTLMTESVSTVTPHGRAPRLCAHGARC